jgi:integrase
MQKCAYAALGHIRIDKITPLDIQRFVRSFVADGLAPETVKCNVRFVSVILNYAVKKRILNYNPCVMVDYPAERERDKEFYTVEEVKKLLELLRNESEQNEQKKPVLMFFTLAAYMGARKGELLGLEWKDVDFDNNTISINRAYYYSLMDKACYTDTPKTKASRRSLKLPANVMDTLKAYKTWQDAQREVCGGSWADTDRIITAWNGQPMHPNAPGYYLDKLCKRTGMRKVTVHSFRHFNASALINSGIDVVTVQTALGHSTAATTLSIYSHAFNSAQTRAMEAISSVMDL